MNELLSSLSIIQSFPLEIIVVDNNSEDKTEAIVKKYPGIIYYKTKKNIGVGARNIGLANATGDIIITLDDDLIGIDESDIDTIINLFELKSDVGAICFKIKDYNSGEVCNWCHHNIKEEFCDMEFVTDEITEGAVAFRKTALEKAGLYPSFFFISYEGVDLLCRLLNNGFITIYTPAICVRHRTHPFGRTNWRRYYYDTRNQIWLVVRNYPMLMGLKYLLKGLSAMLFYSIRDGFIYYWIKGVIDGIKELPKVITDREPLNSRAVLRLKKIRSNQPSLIYILKQRVFKQGIKL